MKVHAGLAAVVSALVAMVASQAMAHFVFIVPQKDDAGKAHIVFSETLEAEDQVDVLMVGNLKLQSRDMAGTVTELGKGTKENNSIILDIPGQGTRVVYGTVDLGYMQRGKAKPHVLVYHPKSIIGDPFDVAATILNHPVIELIAVGKPGALQFQLNIQGKPAGKTQVTVVLPDNTEKKVVTGDDGRTPVFTETGAYGAWARFWEDKTGERDGKAYEQVRHYAMLVAVVPDTK